jgi:putative membrane protein
MKTISKNDRLANIAIIGMSLLVFILISVTRRVKFDLGFDFDTHIFPAISAFLNSGVSILLILGLVAIKNKKQVMHRNIMLAAMACSILFLVSYLAYHFTTVETSYQGAYSLFYYIILFSHITLSGLVLPFILYSVYRGLTGEYAKHKKLTRFVWPIWLYVSMTGVLVYFMIKPYY